MMVCVDWNRLARLIVGRRVELGYGSREAFSRASLISSRLLGDLENARRGSYDRSTVARLEQSLQWASGSVDAALAGGEPTAIRSEPAQGNSYPPLGAAAHGDRAPLAVAWVDDPEDSQQLRAAAASEAPLPEQYRAAVAARAATWRAELESDVEVTTQRMRRVLNSGFRPANLFEVQQLLWKCSPERRRGPGWPILMVLASLGSAFLPVPADRTESFGEPDFPWHTESDGHILPVFTSRERLREYVPTGFREVEVPLEDLLAALPDADRRIMALHFNPGSLVVELMTTPDNLDRALKLLTAAGGESES